jgi:hypothetical protein
MIEIYKIIILLALYGHETAFLAPRKGHGFRALLDKV